MYFFYLLHQLSDLVKGNLFFSLLLLWPRWDDSRKNFSNICAIDDRIALAALAGSQLRTSNTNRQQPAANNQTHEMTVPNELIGCIIGKGGTKIAEIRQISGAMIRISNCEEREGGATDRTITITGNPDAVALAQYLINMRWVIRGLYHFSQAHLIEGQPSDRQEAIPRGSSKVRLSVLLPNSIFNSSRTRPGYVLQWIAMHFPFDLSFLFIYLFISSRISADTACQIGVRVAGVEWFLVDPTHDRDSPIRLFVLLVPHTTCCLT